MLGTIREFKYKVIKNFFNQEEINIIKLYTDIFHRNNFNSFDTSAQSDTHDTHCYKDTLMETMMELKRKKMEEITGLELFPSYTFWRMYTYGADLKPHKDRPSCEISVTALIHKDKDWPIYMDGNEVILSPGDAVIYLGAELEHFRKEYDGDFQCQVFMHYVDKNGPYVNFIFDQKNGLGAK
jgi:hypothetical protein